ncbi:hypothetical protein, partial [Escherichia coli]
TITYLSDIGCLEIQGASLFASCMPIIFTARYMEKVDVLILIFGYINALFLGVFMAVMCIEYWR